MSKAKRKVLNTAAHPIDLAGGRTLGTGETAEDVNTSDPHNRRLTEGGSLHVVPSPKTAPRSRRDAEAGGPPDLEEDD